VPIDWPEQRVTVVAEDLSPEVSRIAYRDLGGGVKQLLVYVPQLAAGRTAQAYVTLEITRASVLEPLDTSIFVLPKTLPRDVRKYLGPSPYIETRHGEIRDKAREIIAGQEEDSAWQQVETIYDWVRDNVKYEDGKLKGALAALRDGTGDCEELTSLFIAFCRVNRIPARTVWVPGHCYPEFYLEDAEGNGYWFPCQAAGTRAFGSMPDHRPILQKGDNFNVPEVKKPQRYVAEFLQTKSVTGLPPEVRFVRELMAAE
jgi:transglutaminase-like putative cysteine protease